MLLVSLVLLRRGIPPAQARTARMRTTKKAKSNLLVFRRFRNRRGSQSVSDGIPADFSKLLRVFGAHLCLPSGVSVRRSGIDLIAVVRTNWILNCPVGFVRCAGG